MHDPIKRLPIPVFIAQDMLLQVGPEKSAPLRPRAAYFTLALFVWQDAIVAGIIEQVQAVVLPRFVWRCVA